MTWRPKLPIPDQVDAHVYGGLALLGVGLLAAVARQSEIEPRRGSRE